MKLLHYLIMLAALLGSACTSESAAAGSARAPSKEQAVRYRLVAVPLVEQFPQTQQRELLPFRLRAPGSSQAKMVDLDNKLVRSAPAGGTIFGFQVSPNRQWVLFDLSNAEYAVASVDGLKDIARPPKRLDLPGDATVVEWRILDDNHLIGYAELPSLEPTHGLTASEIEGLRPRGTLVYLYSIATGTMIPVEIDGSVSQPFSISDDSHGNLTIEPHSGLDAFGVKIIPIPSR